MHRWGPGPVFVFEWLMASRRWQMYAARSGFVALVLVALCLVWKEHVDPPNISATQALAAVGEQFFYALTSTALTLFLLAAPAATAGAVCLDKVRGTLLHLLVTDLSDTEIVLGKLAARLVPILGLLGCLVPVMFLCTLMGGIHPEALLGAFLVMFGVAVLGCSVALTLSVWGSKSYEVLLATYLLWIVLLLAYPMWSLANWVMGFVPPAPRVLLSANPYWLAFAPYSVPGSVSIGDFVTFVAGCLVAAALLLGLAVARMRAVAVRHGGTGSAHPSKRRPAWLSAFRGRKNSAPQRRRRLLGPSLDGNPVLWREWHRQRPSRWGRFMWGLYALLAAAFSVLVVAYEFNGTRGGDAASIVVTLQVVVGLLLVSVAAPNPLAEERARGSMEVLLATPLSTRSILWGKWWGTYRTVPRLVPLPFLTLLLVTLHHDSGRPGLAVLVALLILAYGAAFTSLGLALATWTTRLGRAVTWSVVAYVVMCLGWLLFIALLMPKDDDGAGLAMGSPFFGMAHLSEMVYWPPGSTGYERAAPWAIFWTGAYLAAALTLYYAAQRTFDRCLGRVGERPPAHGRLWQRARENAAPVTPAAKAITPPAR